MRQTDSKPGRQRGRQVVRLVGRETGSNGYMQVVRPVERQTARQLGRQAHWERG